MVTADELLGFRQGDPDAVRAVYREYGGLVFAVSIRTLGSRDLAEESTQRTFVKAWKAAAGFEVGRELGPWLATIARRTAIDIYRREARRSTAPLDDVAPADPNVIELPVGVERSYEAGEVRAAIDALPPDEREVVRLQHLEELTQTEVADRLGVPVGTVKSRPTAPTGAWHPCSVISVRTRDDGHPNHGRSRGVPLGKDDLMTTDDDRVAYLAGEDGQEIDDVAREDLDDLRALLADPAVWAEPSPGLEDAIVAAIAAEVAADPHRLAADAAPATAASRRTTRRRSHRTRNALSAAAAVAVLAAGGVALVNRGDDDGGTQFSLGPTELIPEASGSAEIVQTPSGWRIEIDATGLPRLEDGRFYQAWLKDADDVLVPIGTFNEPIDVVLWAGVSPRQFSTFTVTEEEADGDQASSGRRVLVGTIELDP